MHTLITVQSQKLIPWLVERHVISKDYVKSLEYITRRIHEFTQSSPEKIADIEPRPVQYFYALDILQHLEKTDTTKDFFGRASASIRTLKDIVSRYESEHINLAEVSERLNDLCFLLSRCKSSIADRQKLINDLQRKITEYTANQHSKEAELERFCKQFDIRDEHVRLRLLEKASTLPDILGDYVTSLKVLAPVIDFYSNFVAYVSSDGNKSNRKICPTLRLLINSGHVTVYEWRTGIAPSAVEESDDHLLKMIEMEKKQIRTKEAEATIEDQEIDFADLDANGETDLGDIDFGNDLLSAIDLVNLSNDTPSNEVEGREVTGINSLSHQPTDKATTMATGADARNLLDSTDGRNALIQELGELASFLLRIRQNFLEFQAIDFNVHEVKKKKAGGLNTDSIAPIYHQIMLDAPAEIKSKTLEDVDSMSSAVRKAFDAITDETVTHLSLLRLQPSYLERLTSMMQDLRRQVNRSVSRIAEVSLAMERANEELSTFHTEMVECLQERKRLVTYLEKELSKLYERDIKIIGAAIAM